MKRLINCSRNRLQLISGRSTAQPSTFNAESHERWTFTGKTHKQQVRTTHTALKWVSKGHKQFCSKQTIPKFTSQMKRKSKNTHRRALAQTGWVKEASSPVFYTPSLSITSDDLAQCYVSWIALPIKQVWLALVQFPRDGIGYFCHDSTAHSSLYTKHLLTLTKLCIRNVES